MSAGTDRDNRDEWTAEEAKMRDLFAATAADPGAQVLKRMVARAVDVPTLASSARAGMGWPQWAIGALVLSAAVLALVLLAVLPEGGPPGSAEHARVTGVSPADVLEAYRSSADALAVVTAAEQAQDHFAEQFEDPFEWDDDPGLLDGLAVLAGPDHVDDPEEWERFYDEMLEDWDDLTDDDRAAFE